MQDQGGRKYSLPTARGPTKSQEGMEGEKRKRGTSDPFLKGQSSLGKLKNIKACVCRGRIESEEIMMRKKVCMVTMLRVPLHFLQKGGFPPTKAPLTATGRSEQAAEASG